MCCDVDQSIYNRMKCRLGYRHVQSLMLFLGFTLAYGFRINMSIAIVLMTIEQSNESLLQIFDWDFQTQTIILSSFMVGYILSMIPSAILVTTFGGKLLLSMSIFINSAMSALIPLGAYYGDWPYVSGCRFVQGFGQGTIASAINSILLNWIPTAERNKIDTFIATGMHIGVAGQILMSGYIVSNWNWSTVFYLNSVLGIIWTIVFTLLCSNTPELSNFVSKREINYIKQSTDRHDANEESIKTPWHCLWRSLSFISLVVANCAQNWVMWTFMTLLPLYLRYVIGLEVIEICVFSAMPYIAMAFLNYPLSCISRTIINRNWLTTSSVRKICNSIGFFGPGLCFLGLSFVSDDVTLTVTLLTSALALNAGHYSGFMKNHKDISPRRKETLQRVTNGFADVLSVLAPLTAGAVIKEATDSNDWRPVFNLCAMLYIACNIFYLIFGSSERQHWNDTGTSSQKLENRADLEAKQ